MYTCIYNINAIIALSFERYVLYSYDVSTLIYLQQYNHLDDKLIGKWENTQS